MITTSGNRMSQEIARQARLSQDLLRTQVSISTGKRMIAGSDDPSAAARVRQIAVAQANDTSWAANLQLAGTLATQADDVLSTLTDRMTHAHGLMVAGANGTMNAADRATYAAELRSIAAEVAQLATTQTSLGTPLFATGTPASMRVDGSTVLTPVAAAGDVFAVGGTALTTMLTDAANALDSGNATAISAALTPLKGGIDHVANAAAAQGVRAARIDTLYERNATRGVELAAERSTLEDTDLSAAIAKLNAQQLTLDAAQAAFARINRRTLFDLLG